MASNTFGCNLLIPQLIRLLYLLLIFDLIDDLSLFKSLRKGKTYFGIGFDVHRLVPKRKLYLGGIKIPSSLGTLGHSDGDPVLHAVTDSILGACKMGDIGDEFSNKMIISAAGKINHDKFVEMIRREPRRSNKDLFFMFFP